MARCREMLILIALSVVLAPSAGRAAGLKASAPVPPTQEIEVLDPNVDATGNPKVLLRPGADGKMCVDIPPVLLVHRFFYTGNRNFQGPMVPGGPTIIVTNHPKTGERVYLPVQMLPGAPRVSYTHNSITYTYGPQAMEVHFGLCGQPKVVYKQAGKVHEGLKDLAVRTKAGAKDLVARTGLPEGVAQAREKVKNGVVNGVDKASDAVKDGIVTPASNLIQMIPGAKMLTSTPEDRAGKLRDQEIQKAQRLLEKSQPAFLPTNR